MSTEYLTHQEDNQDIVNIEAQELQKTLQYLEENTTHCVEVGKRLNADCQHVKEEMGNSVLFNNKVSSAYSNIKKGSSLTPEDESVLQLYYMIKVETIPSEQEYQTWRKGLEPPSINEFSTNKPSTNEYQTETLSNNEDLEGIPAAIVISDIIDKAETAIDEFIKKKKLEELQNDKLNELYDEFLENLNLTDRLDTLKDKLGITKKISTLLEESIKVRHIIDNTSSDNFKDILLGLYDDHEGNKERRRGKFNEKDEMLLDTYKGTEYFTVEQNGPALIITLPHEVFEKVSGNDPQIQGLTRWHNIPICFVDAKNDILKPLQKELDSAPDSKPSMSFGEIKKTKTEIKYMIENTKLNIQKTKEHEQKHAINNIFMVQEEQGLNYPKDEMLARLHEKASLSEIWETLAQIGSSYDTSFDKENDNLNEFKKEVEKYNLKEELNDYLLSGIMQKKLQKYLETKKDGIEDIKNYLDKKKLTMDNIKEGMWCIIALDCLCDDKLFTNPVERTKEINKILEGRKKKDWKNWKTNNKKNEKLPKCVINLLSTTKIADRGKIVDYVKENGLTKELECNIPKCN